MVVVGVRFKFITNLRLFGANLDFVVSGTRKFYLYRICDVSVLSHITLSWIKYHLTDWIPSSTMRYLGDHIALLATYMLLPDMIICT